jgi:ubiquinone/menaquinone biosynthesis C-methylase UbiE
MASSYLVAALGEIPDQDAALAELARVLKPGGRLGVGELFGDPQGSPRQLEKSAANAGAVVRAPLGQPAGLLRPR